MLVFHFKRVAANVGVISPKVLTRMLTNTHHTVVHRWSHVFITHSLSHSDLYVEFSCHSQHSFSCAINEGFLFSKDTIHAVNDDSNTPRGAVCWLQFGYTNHIYSNTCTASLELLVLFQTSLVAARFQLLIQLQTSHPRRKCCNKSTLIFLSQRKYMTGSMSLPRAMTGRAHWPTGNCSLQQSKHCAELYLDNLSGAVIID